MTITPAQVSQIAEVRVNDTQRLIYENLTLGGYPIDLTNQTVKLVIHDPATSTTYTGSATVVSAVSGSISYQLTSTDLAQTGSRLMVFQIVNASGDKLYIPSNGYLKLNITPNLL